MLKKEHSGRAQSRRGAARGGGEASAAVPGGAAESALSRHWGIAHRDGREVSALLGAKGPSCATGLKAASPT